MVSVVLNDVWKSFDGNVVLRSVNLSVEKGEIAVILGPSGSGKTTTLKVISGLVKQDRGDVIFGGEIVNDLPPWERGVGFVFQNLALFPHLTVKENIGFGLRARGFGRREIDERVKEMIALFGLDGLEDRLPRQLSGGQQQRVAIARALAPQPNVLLMDEPFSNLDALLREQLRNEIRKILKRLGVTTIFVTHDQVEAMQIADRIAIMMDGNIVQIGKPSEIVEKPRNLEVARFLKLNVVEITGELRQYLDSKHIDPFGYIVFSSRDAVLSSEEGIPAKVLDSHFLKDYWLLEIELVDGQVINLIANNPPEGKKVNVVLVRYSYIK